MFRDAEAVPDLEAAVYFALLYETVDDYIRRRERFRGAHLAHARRARDSGLLLMAGAFDPADGALLIFEADDAHDVEEFARNDPYVQGGVIRSWKVRAWSVVLGGPVTVPAQR